MYVTFKVRLNHALAGRQQSCTDWELENIRLSRSQEIFNFYDRRPEIQQATACSWLKVPASKHLKLCVSVPPLSLDEQNQKLSDDGKAVGVHCPAGTTYVIMEK
ncbi:hypothetical protein KIL84_021783 [Mauremys mutica]|uniref:Uncharacterized protein n=1 Tax=Mauremys mutica TaxID=74926 RepID=A0A9D3XHF4_9SAUR|nr:hypothetical protein KIL84_021783 [Mauremys mutica]